jgi:hypothetical protein
MLQALVAGRSRIGSAKHIYSGVTPMIKMIHRSKFTYGLFVLAVLALSSGAGVKLT